MRQYIIHVPGVAPDFYLADAHLPVTFLSTPRLDRFQKLYFRRALGAAVWIEKVGAIVALLNLFSVNRGPPAIRAAKLLAPYGWRADRD